jgi:hypothetical protein
MTDTEAFLKTARQAGRFYTGGLPQRFPLCGLDPEIGGLSGKLNAEPVAGHSVAGWA